MRYARGADRAHVLGAAGLGAVGRAPGRARRVRWTCTHLLRGLTVWNVNSTASGGGVAEMLQALLAYTRGAGVGTRWLVVEGSHDFFALTKRIHNLLHGSPGDGGPTGPAETRGVRAGPRGSARRAAGAGPARATSSSSTTHRPLGSPRGSETTGHMSSGAATSDVTPLTRRRTGRGRSSAPTWRHVEATIFSRRAYAPAWIDQDRLWVIPPSLDPFSTKNRPVPVPDMQAALLRAGLVTFPDGGGRLDFVRRDGSNGTVRAHPDLAITGGPLPETARVVLQVSRWDRLKDMAGVLTEHRRPPRATSRTTCTCCWSVRTPPVSATTRRAPRSSPSARRSGARARRTAATVAPVQPAHG